MEEFFPGKGENLHDYLIPSAGDIPPVESILISENGEIVPRISDFMTTSANMKPELAAAAE